MLVIDIYWSITSSVIVSIWVEWVCSSIGRAIVDPSTGFVDIFNTVTIVIHVFYKCRN